MAQSAVERAVDPASEAALAQALAAFEPDSGTSDAPSTTLRALMHAALLGPLRDFAARPGKQIRGRMLELLHALAGGKPGGLAPALPLLIEALHEGSLIVDDIEDGSVRRRGAPALHHVYGLPLALNAGNFLYFFAQAQLAAAGLSREDQLLAHERVNACMLRCHQGQALDLYLRAPELSQAKLPEVVRAISLLKTGALFELCAQLAALSAGADPRVHEAFARFGREVGVGLQMFDDLSGVLNPRRRDKALEDLRLGRATWLLAFLALELPPERYLESRRELHALMEGADPDLVIERLRFRSAGTGRARARQQLDLALADLHAVVGDSPHWAPLAAQLDQIEAVYVGL